MPGRSSTPCARPGAIPALPAAPPAKPPRRLPALLCGLAAAGACDETRAGQAPAMLEPVTVTGSRTEGESLRRPYSVDSVDALRIRSGQPGIDASEALARVPGLVVQNRHNYAQDLQISSRGFGARTPFGVRGVKLIADGIPASAPDGQGQAATFNLDTAERFEVLRGPMATLYGSNAGGVIQMFSRDGEGRPQAEAATLAGSHGTRKHRLGSSGSVAGVGYVLDASRMHTGGYRRHSAATRYQTFAKATRESAGARLALVFNGLEQRDTQDPQGLDWQAYRRDPRAASPAALQYDTRKSIRHSQLGASYERRFGAATLQATLYAGRRRVVQYQSIPKAAQQAPTSAGGVIDFDRGFHGAGLRWMQPLAAGPGELTLVAGLDYDRSREDRKGYENFVGDVLGVRGALRRDEIDTATSLDPYVQAEWVAGPWTLQAGLRYGTVEIEVDDRYGANGDDSGRRRYAMAAPAVGAAYALSPGLSVYASAGKGFETPTQGELAYAPGGGGLNADLRPARSRQYEIGVKARLAGHTRMNAAAFRIETRDEIVVAAAQGGRTSYRNAAGTLRRGVELGVESRLAERWRAALAYTWLDASYDRAFSDGGERIAAGNRLPGVPGHSLWAELAWEPAAGVDTALEAVYRDRVHVDDANRARPAPATLTLNWRAQLEQRTGPWTFRQMLRVDNLLDRDYVGSVIVGDGNGRYYEPAPGIAWYAGVDVSYRF